MRLLICDDHAVFADSLAHLLSANGKEVVAVTYTVEQLIEALGDDEVDVCLLDVWFGSQSALDRLAEVRAVAPRTAIMLLTAKVDSALLRAGQAAGIPAIADKSHEVSEIMRLLDVLRGGQRLSWPDRVGIPAVTRPAHRAEPSAQRLASFLTPRERQVLAALVRGEDTTKLAATLGITVATARCHVQNLLTKLGARSRLQAATDAVRYGMVDAHSGEWIG